MKWINEKGKWYSFENFENLQLSTQLWFKKAKGMRVFLKQKTKIMNAKVHKLKKWRWEGYLLLLFDYSFCLFSFSFLFLIHKMDSTKHDESLQSVCIYIYFGKITLWSLKFRLGCILVLSFSTRHSSSWVLDLVLFWSLC